MAGSRHGIGSAIMHFMRITKFDKIIQYEIDLVLFFNEWDK